MSTGEHEVQETFLSFSSNSLGRRYLRCFMTKEKVGDSAKGTDN